jgi:TRAP-type mannitol/chloroaromatic compound transport system permease small subunit
MTENRVAKIALFLLVIFIFSFVFAVIDNGYENFSAYELGRTTGQMMKYFLKNLGTLALIVLAYRLFKENKSQSKE